LDTLKVLVENWQHTPWYRDWIPIGVAIIALLVSLVSLDWTREQFARSSRPFVWASNYGVIDQVNKTIIPIPFRVGFRVKNSPARILRLHVQIELNAKSLFTNTLTNLVRFPDESSEWSFTIGKSQFDTIMDRPQAEKAQLIRSISLEYSSLDGGRVYQFKLIQTFNPADNQWADSDETAD
jgi:hypothetical protein